jgi:hypothetical protein
MSASRSAFAVGLLAALLSSTACNEEGLRAPCGSLRAGGVIEGRVATGDVRPQVRVTADDCAGMGTITTVADETGAFRLELPVGTYILRACCPVKSGSSSPSCTAYFNADGPPYPFEAADTLTVTADTLIVADFELGSLEVAIAVPSAAENVRVRLEGVWASEKVDPPGNPLSSPSTFAVYAWVRDGQAVFAIGGLQPGSYTLRMSLPRTSWSQPDEAVTQMVWLPATRRRADADTICVPAGGTAHYEAAIPDNSVRLTGAITGSWQKLYFGGAQITLVAPDSSVTVASFATRSDGTFAADIQVPEPARMLIDIGGNPRWYPRGGFHEAEILDLAPGSSPLPIEVVESGLLLDIQGTFYPARWNATLQLVAPADSRIVAELDASSSGGHAFLGLANLDPGSYLLHILPQSFLSEAWTPQWFDRATDPHEATLIQVPAAGGVERVTITLEEGGRIEGQIWNDDELNPYGVMLYLTAAGDPTTLGRLWASDTRSAIWPWEAPLPYKARGLPDGEYKIGVWPRLAGASPAQPPEDTIWYPQTTDWNAAQVLTITGNQATTGIDFDLR